MKGLSVFWTRMTVELLPMSLYTHTPRVLSIHFGRETVPSDTDGTRVSKCGQLSQQTRRLDPMLFQCWSSAVGGGPILKQHWVKCSRLLGSTQVSVYTHPSATIIFSPADQGTFSKTAGQSQAYYNT